MMRVFKLWPLLLVLSPAASAQIPPPVIPEGVGVNIHFVKDHNEDLDKIAAAGFKFIRMDFDWQPTEPTPGKYDWSIYDGLTTRLEKHGLRAIYILDYTHSAYEPKVASRGALEPHSPEWHTASPRHPESVAAYARWAAAAAKHFKKDHIIWEIYNEPNGDFWKPHPNADEYAALALAAAKAIRQGERHATIIGPAMAGFEWPFIETCLKSGVLEYIDAVSVHPYRNPKSPPETASKDYKKLRAMIDQYAPKSRQGKIPILSGEWGYSSHTGGISIENQAAYAVRQQLSNLLNGVPLSIWYDWKNDGEDPAENEQNFGTVNSDLSPKPAYIALQEMTRELAGYKIQRRLDSYGEKDFVLLLTKPHAPDKIAAWTTGEPHAIQLTEKKMDLELGAMPKYINLPP